LQENRHNLKHLTIPDFLHSPDFSVAICWVISCIAVDLQLSKEVPDFSGQAAITESKKNRRENMVRDEAYREAERQIETARHEGKRSRIWGIGASAEQAAGVSVRSEANASRFTVGGQASWTGSKGSIIDSN
jgi:hypothetical protein